MWTKESINVLIMKYEEQENLYNVRSPSYLDRVKRANSLFSICQDLKQMNKDITIDDVKKKIHTLRAQYVRESRSIVTSKRSGVGADDVYVPKLWCFSQLHFLKSHCSIRKSESNIVETDEGDNSFLDDSNVCETISPAPPKRKKKDINIEEKIDKVKDLITKKGEEKSSYDWLGKQVVFQVDRIANDQIKEETVWEVQKILRKAILKDRESLSQQPPLVFTPPPEAIFTPLRLSSTSSAIQYTTSQSSSQCTPDLLHQSLIGVLDDDDDFKDF